MKATKRFDWNWILVLALAVFAVAPLTYPGYFEVHSGFLPVFDVTHLATVPAWGPTLDPVRGQGLVPALIAWPFWKLTGSGVAAIKWSYALALLLAAGAVYGWTHRALGARGALLAAVVYTYLPWHLSAVYVRGDAAEAWLWALWPLALWAVDRLPGPRRWAAALGAVAAVTASLATQAGLTAVSILGTMAALAAASVRRRGRAAAGRWIAVLALGAVVVAVRLAARPARIPFGDHFLYPFQLLSASWGYSASVPGWQDGLSFQLGIAAVGLGLAALALRVGRREWQAGAGAPGGPVGLERLGRIMVGWAAALVAIAVLALPVAAWVWRIAGLERLVTYPWQVLALAGLPLAFLAGSVVRLDERLAALPAFAALIALAVLASLPYLAPRFTHVDPGPAPVAMFRPVEATAPEIVLLDADVRPPSDITPTLALTLTWQAVEPVAADYTVFVHLLAPGGQAAKIAQQDSRPCAGECPTTAWQPGEIIVDRHVLGLADGLPAGPYRLAVGLYRLDTGERAAVLGRDDQTVFLDVR